MGLTKPRAAQIFNLDYKQATRVVTVANITLTGGAPSSVDGVSLSVNDRVLVTAQTTGSQNGLYKVSTLGSGANGTWVRTSDGNDTGEIEAGMIVMVTEGAVYADTQWKLITDDPIVIGTTSLSFTQNYLANSITSGTSNVRVFSNANTTISSAGTANVLVISSTGTVVTGTESVSGNITGGNVLTGGLISATGNVTGNYILGNGVSLTGVITSVANINSGTSNVTVVSSGGNVTVGVGGTGNVAVFATTGEYVTGLLSVTGNITGGNVLGGANVNATTHTGTTVSVTGNITGGNVLGGANVNATTHTGTTVSVTGNITGSYFLGNGSALTGIIASAGAAITNGTSNVTVAASSNTTVGVAGTTVATFASTGLVLPGQLTVNSGSNVTAIVNAAGNGVGNVGSSTTRFNTVFALAASAAYADLAEVYVADAHYGPGTVVEFGGNNEITITNTAHSVQVAGIISTNPAYLMNSTQGGKHALQVALVGRVPCSVVGTIRKGDRLVSSGYAGVAQALNTNLYQPGCIVGKALEEYNSANPGVIEVAVGRL